MEITQGNSLCRYLYLKQEKMSFFSSTKLDNRRMKQMLWGDGNSVKGKVLVEGGGGGEKG
jgi:hypothetical protein